jgi:hypothetical protein
MSAIDLSLLALEAGIPPDVKRFLREADQRIDDFQVWSRVPAFVPCDFEGTYRLLRALADSTLPRGMRFCEWGSGFGVAACLAAMVGFEACGIEIDGELVEHASQLAADFDLDVEFVRGSFIPPGFEERIHKMGRYAWFTTDADSAYEELDLDPDDMDVIFVYPWPDEEQVTVELFHRYGGTGAILATYHGGDDFKLRRRISPRKAGNHHGKKGSHHGTHGETRKKDRKRKRR